MRNKVTTAAVLVLLAGTHMACADWWQDCSAERERFCKGIPAGGGRVANCIDEHVNDLSPACRASRPSPSPMRPDRQGAASPSHNSAAESPSTGSPGFHTLYRTNFQSAIDAGLMLQQPTSAAITLQTAPCRPSQRVVRVTMNRQDNYSRVANGVPRAEIGFAGRFTFNAGKEYRVNWSTCLPPDFRFDARQPEGIGQIHPGTPKGSPPFGMVLLGDRYQAQLRDGNKTQTHDIGAAAQDRGRWISWSLRYRPDATGANAITELTKDGVRVLSANGVPNAYPGDNRAYLKIGIYKWWWQERPSDVSERTMFFGDVVVEVK